MKTIINQQNKTLALFWGVIAILVLSSCEDYLEVQDPVGQINTETVFTDENTATAAITTLYGKLRDQVLLTGNSNGLGMLMGLYADELDYYGSPGASAEQFYLHQVTASNQMVKELWDNAYHLIYLCNAAIEGVVNSDALTEEVKTQLIGEALFVRAVGHFYLVNLFGDIPYITTTNYQQNATVTRLSEQLVYEAIISDLLEAKNLLETNYPTPERIRANNYVAASFLARVYLHLGQWQRAEEESTYVINNPDYVMETDLNREFLKESTSAILQLKPKNEGDNTLEGASFIFSSGPPPVPTLNYRLVEEMEEDDLRKESWVGVVSDGTNAWYFPNKYKQNLNTGTTIEYSVVLRIAELHLIRAEARGMKGNLTGAANDLNSIRTRAGLQNISISTSEELIDAILKERRFELFTEYGHRWFDLKRLGLAADVLANIKPGWQSTNILLPIPEAELLLNPNLQPQNPGY
ncbi:MAG: RagB/SusD family nutrient uptake outer membrane protein [Aequorivita sp.]|nr:RagB/SusD family nutrient uptake outer membrane protein [Aequorivita sp.]|tara:strand:+ start:28460 stop:29857 length:1398 start_codon:yes stop_codon:yes gene_type:complete